MTYRLYFSAKAIGMAGEYLPWRLHCEETSELLSAAKVESLLPSMTEQPSMVPGIPQFVVVYKNAEIIWAGKNAVLVEKEKV